MGIVLSVLSSAVGGVKIVRALDMFDVNFIYDTLVWKLRIKVSGPVLT